MYKMNKYLFAIPYDFPMDVDSMRSPSPPLSSPETSPPNSPQPSTYPQRERQPCGRGKGRGSRGRRGNSNGRRGRSSRGGMVGSHGGRGRHSSTSTHHSPTPDREEREWSGNFTGITVEPFDRPTGPAVPVSSDPTEMFLSFFTPALIDQIVMETNRYAVECLTASHTGNDPVPEWKTNAEEILAYFGFSIYMGINRLPDLYDYWSTSDTLHYLPVASRIP